MECTARGAATLAGAEIVDGGAAAFKCTEEEEDDDDDDDDDDEDVFNGRLLDAWDDDEDAGGSKFSAFTALKVFEWSSLCFSELPRSSPKQRNARLRASVTAAFLARSIA